MLEVSSFDFIDDFCAQLCARNAPVRRISRDGLLGQFCQVAIADLFLEVTGQRTRVDLSDQTANALIALRGRLDDGSPDLLQRYAYRLQDLCFEFGTGTYTRSVVSSRVFHTERIPAILDQVSGYVELSESDDLIRRAHTVKDRYSENIEFFEECYKRNPIASWIDRKFG